ncbi:ABC transporter substrate-binding protein [Arthrobacter sp. ov118]|uniref:ABC transporter substrate-binding protein n=1 Tax=Arthrobacter sp. ov118 TaxID=1761747 RepID=UPI0008E7FDE7|nr:ABC transporter substrate-binding protein [Arthrobacter sp. ov118]SFU11342.1 polar amino acid transport system substrate-binding protein [Arthrobacter sp. ov118]
MKTKQWRVLATLSSAVMIATALAACSSASGSTTAPTSAQAAGNCTVAGKTVEADQSLKSQVPASTSSTGHLNIATSGDGPPYTYKDKDGNLTGLEIDLGQAIGCTLGLQSGFKTIAFAGILTGIQAGRYDMGMSTISDTSQREKVMNFVSYQTEGTALIVGKGNPHSVKTIGDTCGLRVAVTQGGITQQLVEKQNALCSEKMTVSPLPAAADGYLSIRSGRADVFLDTFGTALYTSKNGTGSGDALEVVADKRYGIGYQAIALPKTEDGTKLTQVVADAVNHLIETGVYGELYKSRGLEQNELPKVQINDAAKYENSFLDLN